jgi:hypothetical protein
MVLPSVIIRGSKLMASMSGVYELLGLVPPPPTPPPPPGLEEVARDAAIFSWTDMAVFRRFIMKKAATRMTIRIATAPPIIPPIWGVVSPDEGVDEAAVLGIADADAVTLGIIPIVLEDWVAVGAPGMVVVVIVVVTVVGFEEASVVVSVDVKVYDMTAVE